MKNFFVTLKIKLETAEGFRKFSRDLGKQQTDALQLMMDFFIKHGLNPSEDLGPNMKTLEGNINKRINAVIAIIRDIEKTQTKPVLAMIQLLFQENTDQKKKILIEKSSVSNEERKLHSQPEPETLLKLKISETRSDLQMLLKNVALVRNSFGTPYLRLNLSQDEFKSLQTKYNSLN